MESILDKHINHRYCELDGEKCIRCQKCESLPAKPIKPIKSSNRLNKVLITLVIICIIIFIIYPLLMIAMEKSVQTNSNGGDLQSKVDAYNAQMSEEEKQFRQYHGLGMETVGENYNSMG